MALLDAVARAVSSNLLGLFGREVTANVVSATDYNPDMGASETSTASSTVKGVIGQWRSGEIGAGSEIRTTDIKFTMAALGNTAPTTNDTFTIDSVQYEVVEIRPQWSGDQVAYYDVALRA